LPKESGWAEIDTSFPMVESINTAIRRYVFQADQVEPKPPQRGEMGTL